MIGYISKCRGGLTNIVASFYLKKNMNSKQRRWTFFFMRITEYIMNTLMLFSALCKTIFLEQKETKDKETSTYN